MTASEIHIGLGILLQKVNTHKSKNFLPQELDMLFNLTLANYKNKRTDLTSNLKQVSLFDTQTSLDTLSPLFETEVLYPISNNKEEAIVLLPLNFYGWINGFATVAYDCTDTTNTIIDGLKYTINSIYNLKNINITTINTFLLTLEYQSKDDTTEAAVLFDYTLLPDDYLPQDGVKDYKRSFIIINAIVNIINLNLITINENAKDKLYVEYNNKTESLNIASYGEYTVELLTDAEPFEEENYQIITKETIVDKVNALKPLQSIIGISDTEYEPYINNSHLSSSRVEQIRAVRNREKLKIKIPKSTLFSSVTITYIRIPRQIDYLLGIGSDLPNDIINKVIADTAQLIKGLVATDSYDKFVQENTLIE